MGGKVTLVLGASMKPWRYSHMAVKALVRHGHEVVAIGLREGFIDGVPVLREIPGNLQADTVTLYLGAPRQEAYYARLMQLKPRRVIFNPGAENEKLAKLLSTQNTEWVEGCTLVMLAAGQY